MKKISLILSFIVVCWACKEAPIVDHNNQFRLGTFEIPAGPGYGKTTVIRVDSLQIESYTKLTSITKDGVASEIEETRIDTLYIKWKNNFAYVLHMKNPKTELDKDAIYVNITKVTDSSYNFTAKIGYSNYQQKGTLYKLK